MHKVVLMILLVLMLAGCAGQDEYTVVIRRDDQEEQIEQIVETRVAVRLTEIGQVADTSIEAVVITPLPTSVEVNESLVLTPPYDETRMVMIAMLNQWRIREGLWPLQINDILMQMAQDQADYLIGLPALPRGGDLHLGRQGEYPAQRAVGSYGWPSYGSAARTAIGEVAYVGRSERSAYEYWNTSSIHSNTILSSAYREVGVGVVLHPYGQLFIIVFGARPGILPVLVDPVNERVYFSDERYQYASGGKWFQKAQQVQYLVSEGSALLPDEWMTWTLSLSRQITPAPFAVAFTDGQNTIVSTVNPAVDVVWLPDTLE